MLGRYGFGGCIAGLIMSLFSSVSAASGVLEEVAEFGSNPGQLRFFQYRPDSLRTPAPLVVALHGCQQTAVDYAKQAGWVEQADRWGFMLLLPEQRLTNNLQRCFNWFQLTNRDQGESGSIQQMIVRTQQHVAIDSQRIYVAGLSAGGAMAAVLLVNYPDLFAGGAIIAGIPYGCASGIVSGLRCQLSGRDLEPSAWGDLVRQALAGAVPKKWPIVSIWQGTADWVVDATNARELVEQWTAVHGLELGVATTETGQGYSHQVYRDAAGQPRVESYLITGMGHGQAIDPGPGANQCGIQADYAVVVGMCASYQILRFWGLGL